MFGKLWERQRLPEVVHPLGAGRTFSSNIERTSFAPALQRLRKPGGGLQGNQCLRTVECPGFEGLAFQHLYRTTGFLHEVRFELERELFSRDRDLFSQQFDLLFLDTTSTYVYRDEETKYGERGYSRERRPELPQFVLCVAINAQGWPVAWEVFPGNTADIEAFTRVITKLRERFRIGRVVVVADRAMMAHKTVKALRNGISAPFDYVVGCRMRREREVNEEVRFRAGRYQEVVLDLNAKEVVVRDRRYVVCLTPRKLTRTRGTGRRS